MLLWAPTGSAEPTRVPNYQVHLVSVFRRKHSRTRGQGGGLLLQQLSRAAARCRGRCRITPPLKLAAPRLQNLQPPLRRCLHIKYCE